MAFAADCVASSAVKSCAMAGVASARAAMNAVSRNGVLIAASCTGAFCRRGPAADAVRHRKIRAAPMQCAGCPTKGQACKQPDTGNGPW